MNIQLLGQRWCGHCAPPAVLCPNKLSAQLTAGQQAQLSNSGKRRQCQDQGYPFPHQTTLSMLWCHACLQGLPFAVCGVGDLLALFRCVSVRYRFSTDICKPALMGAIGRVYATLEVRCTMGGQPQGACPAASASLPPMHIMDSVPRTANEWRAQ